MPKRRRNRPTLTKGLALVAVTLLGLGALPNACLMAVHASSGSDLGLYGGALHLSWRDDCGSNYGPPNWWIFVVEDDFYSVYHWWPYLHRDPQGAFPFTRNTWVGIPVWMPLILAAGVLLWPRRRHRGSRCARCSYDLTGNVSGRCPECGEPLHSGADG